jgi:cell wall-associated NlpC family hydrolase
MTRIWIGRVAMAAALVLSVSTLSAALAPDLASATGTTGPTGSTAANRSTSSTSSITSSPAASPSQIDSTEALVAALATQISQQQAVLAQADEQYNQAVVNLTATQASLRATTASISAATSRIDREHAQLRDDALATYVEGTSSSAVAAVFAAPTTASQIRRLYQTLGTANVAADVAALKAGQRELAATQSTLLAEQQAQTAQLALESQTRASAAAASAQSEATLAQVRGTLAQQVAQQAATQAVAAARAAAAATTPALAQAAASQAAQAAQVATSVGSGTAAAVNATTAANQAAGSAAGSSGSSGGAPVTLSGGSPPQTAGLAAVAGAVRYLGVPYQYGGMSSVGVDCSGLTALAWAQAGVSLPHSAADQYSMSRHVSMSALEPGDLLFYKFDGSAIIDHVVMYVGPVLNGDATPYGADTIIQAAHTGTVVSLDPYWSSGLVGAARP